MKKIIIALLTLVLFASCGSNADDSNVKVGDVYYSDGTTAHVDSRNKSKDNQVAGFVVSIKNGKPAVIMCRKAGVDVTGNAMNNYYMQVAERQYFFPSRRVFDSEGNELSRSDISGKDSYLQYLEYKESYLQDGNYETFKLKSSYYTWIDSLNNPEDENYVALPDGVMWYIPTKFELLANKDKKGNYPYVKCFGDFQKGKNNSEIDELCGKKITTEREDDKYYVQCYEFLSSTLRISPVGNNPEGKQELREVLAYYDCFYSFGNHTYDHEWKDGRDVGSNLDMLGIAFAEVN